MSEKEGTTVEVERRPVKVPCPHCAVIDDDPPMVTVVERDGPPFAVANCPECDRPNVIRWSNVNFDE